MWNLSVRVSDEAKGSGLENVSLKKGNGTMNTSQDAANENVSLVSYRASCCAPNMELLVVDRAGNVRSCLYSFSTKITQSIFLCLIVVVLGLLIMTEVGIQ